MGYCAVNCTYGEECPRGYECLQISDSLGNPLGYGCVAACWLLE